MRIVGKTLIAFILLIRAIPVSAEEPWDSIWNLLASGPTVQVIDIVDGDTVVIEPAINGAREIRLVGIQAPKIPLGRSGFKAWPYGDTAKSTLATLVLGRDVTLYFGGSRMDRHDRLLAHLKRDDGLWVQGDMLKRGMARVYSFPDNRSVVSQMLAAEKSARGVGRGIWRLPFYDLRVPEEADHYIGRFEVVQGTVLDVAAAGKRVYLNFGADWRTNFTLTIESKAQRLFRESGFDPMLLKGKTIRVRGWLKSFNGAMINLTHPEQIEVLD